MYQITSMTLECKTIIFTYHLSKKALSEGDEIEKWNTQNAKGAMKLTVINTYKETNSTTLRGSYRGNGMQCTTDEPWQQIRCIAQVQVSMSSLHDQYDEPLTALIVRIEIPLTICSSTEHSKKQCHKSFAFLLNIHSIHHIYFHQNTITVSNCFPLSIPLASCPYVMALSSNGDCRNLCLSMTFTAAVQWKSM